MLCHRLSNISSLSMAAKENNRRYDTMSIWFLLGMVFAIAFIIFIGISILRKAGYKIEGGGSMWRK